jgi:hypothetical protein
MSGSHLFHMIAIVRYWRWYIYMDLKRHLHDNGTYWFWIICRQFRNIKILCAFYYGLATGYRLDGPGIESHLWSQIFCTHPELSWIPPCLLYNGYEVTFPGLKRSRCGIHNPPYSSTEVKERVELYLYSPLGLYGPFQVELQLYCFVTCGLFKVLQLLTARRWYLNFSSWFVEIVSVIWR